MGFILAINEAVKGKTNSSGGGAVSEIVQKTVELLDRLDQMIDETPPVKQPQRFGNQAFRTWYSKVQDVSIKFVDLVMVYCFHFFLINIFNQ